MGGDDVAQPDHSDLIDLIDELDTKTNTFFIVYPVDDDLAWAYAVAKDFSAFGGFEPDRYDPAAGEHWVSR